jgi:hypothetical protein
VPLPDLRTEQNELVSGGGMFVEFLPFADDIRCPVFEGGLVEVDGDLVARASVLVESLRMGEFDPSRFENPALQKYWSGVEHLALRLPESSWPGPRTRIWEAARRTGENRQAARRSTRRKSWPPTGSTGRPRWPTGRLQS